MPAVIQGRRRLHASPRIAAALAVMLAALAASLLLTPAAASAAATLTAADAPGYRAAGSGAKLARAALGPRLPKALRGAVTAGTRLTGRGGRTLVSGVFTTATEARAKQALAQARGRGRRVAAIGDGAWLRLASTRRATTATIVLRSGRALGVVRLTLPGRRSGATATAAATAFASTLAAHAQREQLGSSAYQRTLDGIGDDGSIAPATALTAFAIAYGPLPGVKRPGGRDLGVPQSATLAMQLVARVWDRIAPAQRTAVEKRLGARHDDGSAAIARAAAPTLTPSPRFQAIADRYVAFYAGKLPGYNPVVRVFTSNEEITDAGGSKAWADALPLNAADQWGAGAPAYCRVRVPPLGQGRAGTPFFQLIMAHEVFHCFQFQIMSAWRQRSAWIIEGMADWAATSAYATTAAVGAGPYRLYLASASAPAFGRSYDATGVWHALDESHGVGSLWPNVPLVLNAPDDGASFILAGGGDLSFTETWASYALRFTGAGAAWRQTRPYTLPRLDPPAPMEAITDSTTMTTDRYQAKLAAVLKDPRKPLVSLVGSAGRLRAATARHDYGLLDDTRFFCFGTCTCPPSRSGTIPSHERLAGSPLAVALTGGGLPASGIVQYHDLDEYCRGRESRRSGPAESNGDPHLTTFDGLHYDFQAAGEFVLARSRDGALEIQARQEPYRGSRTVTVNTQIAAKVGGRRVTISPGASKDDVPVVRVDGQLDPLPGGSSHALGDGSLGREDSPGGWVDVTWADGSTLVVRLVGNWGVATVIELDGGRAGRVAGLLGDFDGRVGDDLANRAGRAIAYTPKASSGWDGLQRYSVAEEFGDSFFDALYDDVGDAWRIKQRESLFDYAPGQSTKTFTLGKVPAKPVGPEQLRRQQRAEAERICRAHGVTQPGPLADCITDVAATGNTAFADDAREAQDAASTVWRRLGAGSGITGEVSLVRGGDGALHVGYNRDVGANVRQLGSVAIDAAGHAGAEETIAAADGGVGLFAAADGSVHAVSAEIPNGASSGVYQYGRDGAGAWSPLGLVTGFGSSYASRPSALALPDGTLVTVSPMAGVARVFVGTAAGEGTQVPVPDGCYGSSPSIARDAASGAVFVAWLQWDCPQVGIFAAQFDPATGGFGAPVQAPGSTWSGGSSAYPSLNLSEDVALTARPGRDGLFLAYESGPRGDVALWQIGTPSATKISRRRDGARHVRISADPSDGRLWVGWEEPGRWWFQRTTAAAAPDGAPRPVAPPANDSGDLLRLSDLQISARAGGLDLVHALRRGDTPGALSYARLLP